MQTNQADRGFKGVMRVSGVLISFSQNPSTRPCLPEPISTHPCVPEPISTHAVVVKQLVNLLGICDRLEQLMKKEVKSR